MVVTGIRDDSRLLVLPILKDGLPVELVLLHLELRDDVSAKHKLRFLQAFPHRAEEVAEHLEEMLGRRIEIAELTALDVESLVFAQLAEIDPDWLSSQPQQELMSAS